MAILAHFLSLASVKSAARHSCPDVNEQLLQDEIIGSLRRGDVLVIRLYLPKPQYVSYSSKDMLPPVDAYDEALLRLSTLVKEKGAYMILIGANPTLTFDEILSAHPQWFYFNKGGTVKEATDPETQYYLAQESHLMRLFPSLPNASYFPLHN